MSDTFLRTSSHFVIQPILSHSHTLMNAHTQTHSFIIQTWTRQTRPLLSVYSCAPPQSHTRPWKDKCLFPSAELMRASVPATSALLHRQTAPSSRSAWAWKREVNIRTRLFRKSWKSAAHSRAMRGAAGEMRSEWVHWQNIWNLLPSRMWQRLALIALTLHTYLLLVMALQLFLFKYRLISPHLHRYCICFILISVIGQIWEQNSNEGLFVQVARLVSLKVIL